MVEGGARVITSFLKAQLADRFVITLTPYFIGGVHAVERLLIRQGHKEPVQLERARIMGNKWFGRDLVLWGAFK
jgi:riboflavin biosynthesis pyrimidine reductase